MKNNYIPEKGDFVMINFTPQSGHEQAGHRPALVLTPYDYNRKTGLFIVCPITTKVKGYPFEVGCNSSKITGVILVDQYKSLDWEARETYFKDKASVSVLKEVLSKLGTLLGI